jgi:hypothetical protein
MKKILTAEHAEIAEQYKLKKRNDEIMDLGFLFFAHPLFHYSFSNSLRPPESLRFVVLFSFGSIRIILSRNPPCTMTSG